MTDDKAADPGSSKLFRVRRRVEFRDTDAAGIMHFSTFFTYMEAVEHEFLRDLGKSVMPSTDGPHLSWPRVAAQCEYLSPLRFEDEFEVELNVIKLGHKSITYGFKFLKDGTLHASGSLTAVCCLMQRGNPPKSEPVPDDFRVLFTPYLRS